jgi:hypothetical protein
MHTHTRTMFGSGTKNRSRVIPAEPSPSITRSRDRGTVIFTHYSSSARFAAFTSAA